MPRKRNPELGYIDLNEYGISLTLRQRTVGGPYHLDCAEGPEGERDRHSTGFSDREKAIEYGREYLRRIVKERIADAPPLPSHQLTFGRLFDEFRKHKLPRLGAKNRSGYDTTMRVVEAVLGRGRVVVTLDQDALDELERRRKAGGIVIPNASGKGLRRLGKTRQGTARADYRYLHAVLEWATKKSTGPGTWLLDVNPLARLDKPAKEKNPRQPISDQRRFEIMLEYVDRVDPTGRLKLILYIARYTGRRRGEICRLRSSDVLLDVDLVRAALADRADQRFPDSIADLWEMGLRWPEDANKQGLHWVVPIGPVLAGAFREYLAKNPTPTVGDAPLFPAEQDITKSVHPDLISRWFRTAETLALLEGHPIPHLKGGTWHPLRRMYRTEKKRAKFDTKDVFFIAGWAFHDGNAGNAGYLHYDAADLLEVARHEPAPEGLKGGRSHARSHTAG